METQTQFQMQGQNSDEKHVVKIFNSIKDEFQNLYLEGMRFGKDTYQKNGTVITPKIFAEIKKKAEYHARANSVSIEKFMFAYYRAVALINQEHRGSGSAGKYIRNESIDAQVGFKLNSLKGNFSKMFNDDLVKRKHRGRATNFKVQPNKNGQKNGNYRIVGDFGEVEITCTWTEKNKQQVKSAMEEVLEQENARLNKLVLDLRVQLAECKSSNRGQS